MTFTRKRIHLKVCFSFCTECIFSQIVFGVEHFLHAHNMGNLDIFKSATLIGCLLCIIFDDNCFHSSSYKVSKSAKIRTRYNQVPLLTQDTNANLAHIQISSKFLGRCMCVYVCVCVGGGGRGSINLRIGMSIYNLVSDSK